MSATPAISVVMPAWNAAPFLDAAIESILGQTWRDFEFIILDDGSTDGTREKIAAWAARDARIRAVPNEGNLGNSSTILRGLALARAPWIARMDADDLSRPERLARQWAAAQRNPTANFVTCPLDRLVEDGRILPGERGVRFETGLLPWFMFFYNRIGGGGQAFMAAEALRATGGFEPGRRICTDLVAWYRLMRLAPPVVVDEPLYVWRATNPNSVTRARTFRYIEPGLAMCRAELAHGCGVEVSRDQSVALRDFWVRFPAPENDWDEVQALLLRAIAGYRPVFPVPEFAARARAAVAGRWWSHAVRALRQRNTPLWRGHLRRAREAAGRGWPVALGRFFAEAARVGGRLDRLT